MMSLRWLKFSAVALMATNIVVPAWAIDEVKIIDYHGATVLDVTAAEGGVLQGELGLAAFDGGLAARNLQGFAFSNVVGLTDVGGSVSDLFQLRFGAICNVCAPNPVADAYVTYSFGNLLGGGADRSVDETGSLQDITGLLGQSALLTAFGIAQVLVKSEDAGTGVPEPATALLLAVGLVAMTATRRRSGSASA